MLQRGGETGGGGGGLTLRRRPTAVQKWTTGTPETG
jgi:hypothetical protein